MQQKELVQKSRLRARSLMASLSVAVILPSVASPARAAEPPQVVIWTAPSCEDKSDEPVDAAGPLAAILELVAKPLLKAGIKGLGSLIAKAGGPRDIHGSGQQAIELYTVRLPDEGESSQSPKLDFGRKCIAIATGPKPAGSSLEPTAASVELMELNAAVLTTESELSAEVDAILKKTLDPSRRSLLLVSLEQSQDGTAFRLVPVHASLGEAFDGRAKPRSLAFTISMFEPSATGEGTTVATRTIVFKNVTGSKVLPEADAKGLATNWMPLPPVPQADQTLIAEAAQRLIDLEASEALAQDASLTSAERKKANEASERLRSQLTNLTSSLLEIAPYNLRGDVHETRPGSPLLVKLGNLISEQADTAAAPLAEALSPQKRAEAAEAAAQQIDTLRIEAITQAAEHSEALANNQSASARIAKIRLDSACRRLEAAGSSDAVCILEP